MNNILDIYSKDPTMIKLSEIINLYRSGNISNLCISYELNDKKISVYYTGQSNIACLGMCDVTKEFILRGMQNL